MHLWQSINEPLKENSAFWNVFHCQRPITFANLSVLFCERDQINLIFCPSTCLIYEECSRYDTRAFGHYTVFQPGYIITVYKLLNKWLTQYLIDPLICRIWEISPFRSSWLNCLVAPMNKNNTKTSEDLKCTFICISEQA